ncbi:MAG TPA: metallophosphoesterase [Polyangiaceae bacterium]|nr:metallophosphoesterase [Polyangiaceae bacterium]HMR77069.1 metallophosphoesterase [Polyangiaceae bacterium]
MPARSTVRVAVVGDVHLKWNACDVEYFNDSDYDIVLFVGDLGNYRHKQSLVVAESMARLRVPALLLPGNHDAVFAAHLLAEIAQRSLAVEMLGLFGRSLTAELRASLGSVTQCGYSVHRVSGKGLSIVAGRPHAMGGSQLSFAPLLRREHDIVDLEASRRRYFELIDSVQDERILLLAHNGPHGLGEKPDDIWGCDFRDAGGDFGDQDLTDAVAYAKRSGKQLVAVVAGHMHRRVRGGGQRIWKRNVDDVLYVNAAEVPRIRRRHGRVVHHHVRVLVGNPTTAEDIWVPRPEARR